MGIPLGSILFGPTRVVKTIACQPKNIPGTPFCTTLKHGGSIHHVTSCDWTGSPAKQLYLLEQVILTCATCCTVQLLGAIIFQENLQTSKSLDGVTRGTFWEPSLCKTLSQENPCHFPGASHANANPWLIRSQSRILILSEWLAESWFKLVWREPKTWGRNPRNGCSQELDTTESLNLFKSQGAIQVPAMPMPTHGS